MCIKKNIFIPTENEKINSIKHINYEISMLSLCYKYYMEFILNNINVINKTDQDNFYNNIFVEAFLIHYRNLYYFFYRKLKNRFEDEIIAEDYLTDIKNFYKFRTSKNKFGKYIDTINKMLSHLSYSREKYIFKQKNQYIFKLLFSLMEKTEKAFFDILSKENKYQF